MDSPLAYKLNISLQRLTLTGLHPVAMTPFWKMFYFSLYHANKKMPKLTNELSVQHTGSAVHEVPLAPMTVIGEQVTVN